MLELTMEARKLLHASMNIHRRSASLDLNAVKKLRPRRSTKIFERNHLEATVKAKETRNRAQPSTAKLIDALSAGKVLSTCQRAGKLPFAWANWAYDDAQTQSSEFWAVYEHVIGIIATVQPESERKHAKIVSRVGLVVILAMQDYRYRIFAHQPAYSSAEICRRCNLSPQNFARDGWKSIYEAAVDAVHTLDEQAIKPVQDLVEKARRSAA